MSIPAPIPQVVCSQCQGEDFEHGKLFSPNAGILFFKKWQGSTFKTNWAPQFGLEVMRCRGCGHLEMFVPSSG